MAAVRSSLWTLTRVLALIPVKRSDPDELGISRSSPQQV